VARPRRLDDDELLARIVTALEQRTEMTMWSLADVAPAAGIGPAGLIKRFGSKAGLLHALTRRWIDLIPAGPLPVAADPEAELWSYVGREFGADTSAGAVFALSEVLGELHDPELVSLLAHGWGRQAAWLAVLLEAMQLPNLPDPQGGGVLLLDALHGSLFRSAVNLGPSSPLFTLKTFLETWK
jgi:AcrR family transcriptional regulator